MTVDDTPAPDYAADFDEKLDDLEVTLSKRDGADWPKPKMTAFLAFLERWADHHGRRGYRVISDPDPGPGTMRWRAEK